MSLRSPPLRFLADVRAALTTPSGDSLLGMVAGINRITLEIAVDTHGFNGMRFAAFGVP